ncbi:MAG: hypothetical protein Q9226_002559 [Calogaya cf. arnoldii]
MPSSTAATIPTTFLIISDTHNFTFSPQNTSPLQLPTPEADVLLHSGDLTEVGGISAFKEALTMLGSIPAELKLVIAGNHDLGLDQSYCDAKIANYAAEDDANDGDAPDPDGHRKAMDVMTRPLARAAGVTYLTEGTHSFTLNSGATFKIHVSPYTPQYGDWAFAYKHHEDRFNLAQDVVMGSKSIAVHPIPEDADIIMTHGPAKRILDSCAGGNVGCPNLLQAVKRVRSMIHCFGHVHEGSGVEVVDWKALEKKEKEARKKGGSERKNEAVHRAFETEWIENPYPEAYEWRAGKGSRRGETTLAVNASVMDGGYRPNNAPWRVKVDLKRAG